MAGVTSVGGTGYSPYYVSNVAAAGSETTAVNSAINASRQQRIKKDSDSFNDAVQNLKSKLKAFDANGVLADLFIDGSTSDSFRVLMSDSIGQMVNAYNKVNDIIKSSKYVTGEGAKLFDWVQDFIAKDAENYSKMGLGLDEKNGVLKFDDKKFAAYFDDNIVTTQKLLMSNRSLTNVLQDIARSVLNKQSGYYFVKSIDVRV